MRTEEETAQGLERVALELRRRGQGDLAVTVADAATSLRAQSDVLDAGLLTTGEAARRLGVRSVNTVKRWVHEGLLEGFRRGGRVLVTERSVRDLAEHSKVHRQRALEGELDAALASFDAGGELVPLMEQAWEGRKPWERDAEPGS